MQLYKAHIGEANRKLLGSHSEQLDFLARQLNRQDLDIGKIIRQLSEFQVAIPSWALGAGGTRFGRFPVGGEPPSLEEKIEDIGLVHALTATAGAISLHIPWDIPEDPAAIRQLAESLGLVFDAVNSNTFQDQPGQPKSYKFGSLCHEEAAVREQAITHNLEVIEYGRQLGSDSITIWLADGSSFPGQLNFQRALEYTLESLQKVYSGMPDSWRMFIEYKPYEPHFYSMVIPDWGTSLFLAESCGERAFTLVDLGHHLPGTNIEQIVATLLFRGRLGGFHFNDSKYGDDDLTVGSIQPYQLFLIFNELVYGMKHGSGTQPAPAWMIDASHNLKDPLEDLLQSLEAILTAYARALMVDQKKLRQAQESRDPAIAQQCLQDAFCTDVRPLVRESRLRAGAALDPLGLYRKLDIRARLIQKRGSSAQATGL